MRPGLEPRAFRMLGQCSTKGQYPYPKGHLAEVTALGIWSSHLKSNLRSCLICLHISPLVFADLTDKTRSRPPMQTLERSLLRRETWEKVKTPRTSDSLIQLWEYFFYTKLEGGKRCVSHNVTRTIEKTHSLS